MIFGFLETLLFNVVASSIGLYIQNTWQNPKYIIPLVFILSLIYWYNKTKDYDKLKIRYKQFHGYMTVSITNNGKNYLDDHSFVLQKPILQFSEDVRVSYVHKKDEENVVTIRNKKEIRLNYLKKKSSIVLKVMSTSENTTPKIFSDAFQKGFDGKLKPEYIPATVKTWYGYILRIGNIFICSMLITILFFWGLRSFKIPLTIWNELIQKFSNIIFITFLSFFIFSVFFNIFFRPNRIYQIKQVFQPELNINIQKKAA